MSLWLTTEIYLLISTPNLQTNTNIYSIHPAILYIQKKPFLSVLHSVYDVSVLPTLHFILAMLNLPLQTVTSSTNKYDAPQTSPANSLYKPKSWTNLNEYHSQLPLIHHSLTSLTSSKNISICCSPLIDAKESFSIRLIPSYSANPQLLCGSFRCGKNCATQCPCISHGLTTYTLYRGNSPHKI